MLRRFLGNVVKGRPPLLAEEDAELPMRRVLNVGGGNKQAPFPPCFDGWDHVLLDIAPGPGVDVVADARLLSEQPAGQYDAIYCSHNLEHYYRHDCARVLAGFAHVLKPTGFVDVRVPDIDAVLKAYVARGLDIDGVLYESDAGPISVHDVIYGFGKEIERSRVDFYAHKRGFTLLSLHAALGAAGFAFFSSTSGEHFAIRTLAFRQPPTDEQRAMLDLEPGLHP